MAVNKKARREAAERAAEERKRTEAKRRLLRNLAIGVGAVIVLVGVFLLIDPQPTLTGETSATAWDLPELDGEGRVALADFEGTPLVAAFFADWCPHCRRELPHYAAVSEDLGNQVAWVGINSANSGSGLAFAKELGIDRWPLARDVGGNNSGSGLFDAHRARGMPLTVFYNADGSVARTVNQPLTEEQLRAQLAELFGVTG